jgi:hypothetical protein
MVSQMKRSLISILIIILLVLPAVPLSGCGDARPDFEEIINEAIKANDELQTYRMDMESNRIEKGEPEQSSGWMEFVAPDRIHTISQPMQENVSGEEQIQIGTVIYSRDIDSDDWHTRDWEDERFSVRNIATGMLQSFGELTNIKELRDEKIDGIDCFHYIGSMNMKGQQEEQLAAVDKSDSHYEQQKLMYESIKYVRDEVEFWIGKNDYLLRQYITYIEISEVRDKGEGTEEVDNYSSISTCKFSDFNEPLEIEPPLMEPFEGVNLTASMREVDSTNNDPEHQLMDYEITIVNMGTETANNLRLFIESKITNQGLQTYEAKADTMTVNLKPVEKVTYHVSWEFNLIELTKEKFLEYIRQNTVRATWIDIDGVQHEEVLITGEE